LIEIRLFQSEKERVKLGVHGTYPEYLIETPKGKSELKHPINETLTRPWLRHFFIMQVLRGAAGDDDVVSRDQNLLEIFKTTIPLPENSFIESAMSSWRMFIDSAFRDADTPWYNGIRKSLVQERFYTAIEQLELEIPESNPQRAYQFQDHTHTMRRISRVPVKLFFSFPGNEKEKLLELLRLAVPGQVALDDHDDRVDGGDLGRGGSVHDLRIRRLAGFAAQDRPDRVIVDPPTLELTEMHVVDGREPAQQLAARALQGADR